MTQDQLKSQATQYDDWNLKLKNKGEVLAWDKGEKNPQRKQITNFQKFWTEFITWNGEAAYQ